MSLKILTVLYIGGAVGAAQLLSCQHFDGTGQFARSMGRAKYSIGIGFESLLQRAKECFDVGKFLL